MSQPSSSPAPLDPAQPPKSPEPSVSQPTVEPVDASASIPDNNSLDSCAGVERPPRPPRPKGMARYPRLMRAFSEFLKQYGDNEANPPPAAVEMDASDVFFRWRLELRLPDGTLFPINGQVVMPDIVAPHMMPEAMNGFETTFAALVMRPAFSKFQTILNRYVEPGADRAVTATAGPRTGAPDRKGPLSTARRA